MQFIFHYDICGKCFGFILKMGYNYFIEVFAPFFDAITEKVERIVVRLKFICIDMEFWLAKVFNEIINVLGHFYEVDIYFKETRLMAIAHILGGKDLKESLVKCMYLKKSLGPIV